jgi:hypothetical protein
MTVEQKEKPAAGAEPVAPAPAEVDGADQALTFQPGHVMQRQHYERMAREAAQK